MDASGFDKLSTSLATADSRRDFVKRFIWGLVVVPFMGIASHALPRQGNRTFKCPPNFPCTSKRCCNSLIFSGNNFCCGQNGICCGSLIIGDFCCKSSQLCSDTGCV